MPQIVAYPAPNVPGAGSLGGLYAAAGQAERANIEDQRAYQGRQAIYNTGLSLGKEAIGSMIKSNAASQQRQEAAAANSKLGENFINSFESENPDAAQSDDWKIGKAAIKGGAHPRDVLTYLAGREKAMATSDTANRRADTYADDVAGKNANREATGAAATSRADTAAGNLDERISNDTAKQKAAAAKEQRLKDQYGQAGGVKPTVAQRYAASATPEELVSAIAKSNGDVGKIGLARNELRRRGLDDNGQPTTPDAIEARRAELQANYDKASSVYDQYDHKTFLGMHSRTWHAADDATRALNDFNQKHPPKAQQPQPSTTIARGPDDQSLAQFKAANPSFRPQSEQELLDAFTRWQSQQGPAQEQQQ